GGRLTFGMCNVGRVTPGVRAARGDCDQAQVAVKKPNVATRPTRISVFPLGNVPERAQLYARPAHSRPGTRVAEHLDFAHALFAIHCRDAVAETRVTREFGRTRLK